MRDTLAHALIRVWGGGRVPDPVGPAVYQWEVEGWKVTLHGQDGSWVARSDERL